MRNCTSTEYCRRRGAVVRRRVLSVVCAVTQYTGEQSKDEDLRRSDSASRLLMHADINGLL